MLRLPYQSLYRHTSIQCRPHRSPCVGRASSRSTTRSAASGLASAANSRSSSIVGGSPVRSSVTRRSQTEGSAAGRGMIPRRSCSAATNASTGSRTQRRKEARSSAAIGWGSGGRVGVRYDQYSAGDSGCFSSAGATAPPSIQRRSNIVSSAVSGVPSPAGGIRNPASPVTT